MSEGKESKKGGGAADKAGAFASLLWTLSRIPGLGFLGGAASQARSASRAAKNAEDAKKQADNLSGKN